MHQGSSSVPPGYRFHPTEEELLSYYLRRKVASDLMDPDIIREVDLSKLQPWDLQDHCGVGMGPRQDHWYLFSQNHNGIRLKAATTAGYWKGIMGRDKAIVLGTGKRIGLRKTLVFYTSTPRASRGRKTDWIMHEYRLDDDDDNNGIQVPHDGWVVCKVFKKKTTQRQRTFKRSCGLQPVTGFLDNLLSPFKTIKTVQFNLNLALFGPFGLQFDLGF